MTDARVDKTYEDKARAREFLVQAEELFEGAGIGGLPASAQVILLHNAATAACDAILAASGLRVTSGDGAHVLRLETALDQVGQDSEDLLERLDASRVRRNEASYAALPVASASVDEAREATAELLRIARDFAG